jgi:U3 small nucleolar RNA-associated protein 14
MRTVAPRDSAISKREARVALRSLERSTALRHKNWSSWTRGILTRETAPGEAREEQVKGSGPEEQVIWRGLGLE